MTAAEDKSWRMRFVVARRILELAKCLGSANLTNSFIKFLQDPEGEVKIAATSKVAEFCKFMDADSIVKKIIPHLKTISNDSLTHVRRMIVIIK